MKLILVFIALVVFVSAQEEEYRLDNIDSNKSVENMKSWLAGDFGLKPYRPNYILPYGYSTKTYQSNIPTVDYTNQEAELQVSLKLQVAKNLFGLNERYYVSYTHQAFWQIYINSAPFRENLYNPEGFVIFPIDDKDSMFKLHSFKLALAHRSNGQPDTRDVYFENNQSLGNLSRSVNYVYATLRMQHKTLLTDITAWIPFPESKESSDNPDLMDYTGYSSIKFTYFFNEHMFTLMGRGNYVTQRGAVEATYSYPLWHDNFFVKFFSGYTESLIDYNHNLTKISVGFSFSR